MVAAENNIIVAFELGSSAIRGVAGKREADGSIQILAVEQERISGSIRRGTVYNINKTTNAITRIKDRLNERLGVYITRAYVGIAGQSLHTAGNKVIRACETKEKMTQEVVDMLMDENRAVEYPDREILDVAPQEYRLGIDSTADPIGIQADRIEGRYLNIIARKSLQEDIRTCMRDAGLDIVELLITPLELAKALLPDTEKRSGCALVDIGAETTTVAIFTKNILRHLVTLPLGGNNVTTDLANLKKMEMDEAESVKLKFGVAQVSADKMDSNRQIHISSNRNISEEELQRITSARYDEIIANVWNQIGKDKWQNDLLSGVTLTGGGAAMQGLAEAFAKMKNFDPAKIKIAKQLLSSMQCVPSVDNSTIGFNAAIALLMSATEGCVGEAPVQPDPEELIEETLSETAETVQAEEREENPKSKKRGIFGRLVDFAKGMVEDEE